MYRLLIILSTILSALNCMPSELLFINEQNGFLSYGQAQNAIIDNGSIVIKNSTGRNMFNIAELKAEAKAWRIDIVIANLNNAEGIKYSYTTADGKHHKKANTTWGVVWNYSDSLNYSILELKANNTSLYDSFDVRSLEATVCQISDGRATEIARKTITKGINLYTGFNRIRLESVDGKMTISIGQKKFTEIAVVGNSTHNLSLGYFAGPGSKVALQNIVFEYEPLHIKSLTTNWTIDSLNRHFEKAADPIEGYWDYFDRNISGKGVIIGGKYSLAIVKTEAGYDIIYISGATSSAENWTTGMKKGYITPTRFVGNFNLIWYDSNTEAMTDDNYVQFVDGSILEAHFPVEKSMIRFVKRK
ncbi:MAG: hypothetical protein ACI4A8_02410 [Muribaculaceae bacterium]